MGGEGVAIIRALLVAASGVTSLVPAARIQGDALPEDTALPAILIESVSSIPTNNMPAGATKFYRDRVQVTPHAKDYVALQPIVKAIWAACADKFPTVSGLSKVAVLAVAEGPDDISPINMARAKALEFIVTYNR